MLPRIFLNDMFDDGFFTRGRNEVMKTDIKEKDGNYILEIDLPGCDKDNIKVELNNGYLTVSATMDKTADESDEKDNYIHKERFYGKCSRSYYAGENLKEEDIKASFKNGILTLTYPKDKKEIESEKKYIAIDD